MAVRGRWAGPVWLLLAMSSVVGADQKVGDLARPGHLVIQGAEAISGESIKTQLRYDPSVQIAGQPDSPLAEYLDALRRQTLRGYQAVGFADVKVDVRAHETDATIVIAIEEGRRYVKGKVQVAGVSPELEQYIVEQLTNTSERSALDRRPDMPKGRCQLVLSDFGDSRRQRERTWWVEGERACFYDTALERYRDRVRAVLRDRGYDRASLDVSYEMCEDRANLIVRVDDLGPAMIIRSVWVAGNKKNSEQEVIECGDARPGTLLTAEEYSRIGRRLWQSARFVTQNLEVIPAADGVNLMIVVKEYPPAPRLSEPLSREEAVLLKMREWFVSGEGQNEDLMIEFTATNGDDTSLSIVMSFRDGVIAVLSDPRVSAANSGWTLGGIICDRRASVYSRLTQTRIDFDLEGMRIEPDLGFAFKSTAQEVYNLAFEMGIRLEPVKPDEESTLLSMTLRFEPVGFLSLAHREDLNATWEGDVLTLQTRRAKIVIDGQSGRLIEQTVNGDGVLPMSRTTTRRGAYEELRTRLEQEMVDSRQVFRPDEPISSIAEFFLASPPPDQTVGEFDPAKYLLRQEHRDVLRKLINRGALRPADQLAKDGLMVDGEFHIPREAAYSPLVIWHRFAGAADTLWPYGTWTWHVWRGTAFLYGRSSEVATKMYQDLKASNVGGPLAWWMISRLAGRLSMELSVDAAYRGLKTVDEQTFLSDCDALLDPDAAVGSTIRSTVHAIADMSDEELLDLGQLLSECGVGISSQAVLDFMALYRLNASAEDPLRETLRQCWDLGLRSALVNDLRSRKSWKPATTAANTKKSSSRDSKASASLLPSLGYDTSSYAGITIEPGWESIRLLQLQESKARNKK